jgi:hypothetical protein
MNKWLIFVMIYELLLSSKQQIKGSGKVKKFIMENKFSLQAELTRLKIKYKIKNIEEFLPESIRNPDI